MLPKEPDSDEKISWFNRILCHPWLLDFLAKIHSLNCFNKPKKNSELRGFKNVECIITTNGVKMSWLH